MSNWTPCDNTSSLVSSHYSIDHTLGSWTLTPHLLIIFIIPPTLTIVPLFLVTISSYFPVTPLWHKELHHTQDHIGNSALYWVSFPAVFMPSGPASGWPLASSPLCLWRASVHRASLHFRHLLCLQTSSSNTTVSPILVTVWSWHLPARSGCLLLTEKLPTSCQTPTAHYVLHGEPQCRCPKEGTYTTHIHSWVAILLPQQKHQALLLPQAHRQLLPRAHRKHQLNFQDKTTQSFAFFYFL